jgi:crotonobetainyl-CoA:carnitine CoA-transferase CaiB-like acyl-CoA transferase
MKRPLPLSGLRVLDLTRILSGPFCTMKLGDMGADVVKVEQPGRGDDSRGWGPPFVHGESAYFLSVNRNKRSLTLNLKSPQGKDVLRELIELSDVLVENFRAGVMESLGFGYRKVRKINPRVIYCSISGYGQKSSKSHKPTYDLIIQGESGLMDVTGFSDGPPVKAGISLADVTAGTIAFEGILLALIERDRTGTGRHVDISLLDGLLSLFAYQGQIALSTKNPVSRKGNRHPTITPYETYAAKDGYLNVAVGSEPAWRSFCSAVGREKLSTDPRFRTNAERVKHRGALERILIPLMKMKKAAEWIRRLERADVPAGRINSIPEALRLSVLRERKMLPSVSHSAGGTLRMVGSPFTPAGWKSGATSPPPRLGEHTREILEDLGFSETQIATLGRKGIV